jgi:hypothetical protein
MDILVLACLFLLKQIIRAASYTLASAQNGLESGVYGGEVDAARLGARPE